MTKLLLSSALALSLIGCAGNTKESVPPEYNTKIPEQIMTPDKVETHIGELDFYDGVPTKATVQKVYDNLDYLRGIDVFLNFIPACSIEGMRTGTASLGVSKYNEGNRSLP
jgi:hypothetical protein